MLGVEGRNNNETLTSRKLTVEGRYVPKEHRSMKKGSREGTRREEMLSVGQIWK